ncbi:MAG: bifunctional precorrin-2 dehydrogenase/sirohydrochlorin ferrochelatase [Deltaproteobacteria bacterium]|nr:bifunctional precorrin-2 dehydrogenase/sirohydrochlorin ferrochelatase [Deltaproteobacteria bacterium]
MPYYAIFLDLGERPCLVVGGGAVALGKVRGLLRAGARVTVVAERAIGRLRALAAGGEIALAERAYRRADMRGIHLAVAATGDPEVNRRVAADGERRGVLVNVVDVPALSSFISPATLERGALQVAVSTSGTSPSFAAYLRDRLGEEIGPEYAAALAVLGGVRERLRSQDRPSEERRRVLRALAERGLVGLVKARDRAGVDELLGEVAGVDVTLDALGVRLGE